jgi:hypothetical protein
MDKILFRTTQEIHLLINTNRSEFFREINAVYSENHTKHTNTLCGQNVGFRMLNVPFRPAAIIKSFSTIMAFYGVGFEPYA